MGRLNRLFISYSRQTGASGRMTDLQSKIINVISVYKHIKADYSGSSSGPAIEESGKNN